MNRILDLYFVGNTILHCPRNETAENEHSCPSEDFEIRRIQDAWRKYWIGTHLYVEKPGMTKQRLKAYKLAERFLRYHETDISSIARIRVYSKCSSSCCEVETRQKRSAKSDLAVSP